MPTVSPNEEPLLTPDAIWRAECGGDGDIYCRYGSSLSDIYARPGRLVYRSRDCQGGLNGWSVTSPSAVRRSRCLTKRPSALLE